MCFRRLVKDYESNARSSKVAGAVVDNSGHGKATDQPGHRELIQELTAQPARIETALGDLATARKVVLDLGEDEPVPTTHPGLPDNPAYQHILAVLTDATTPLRRKDLCHALDIGTEPNRIEGMRAKLKRLIATGLVTEHEPGLFAIPR